MKPYLYALFASLGLLSLYAVTMTALNGWQAAVEQFQTLWFLMLPLAAGFGVQVGLYTKLNQGAGSPPGSQQNFVRLHSLGSVGQKTWRPISLKTDLNFRWRPQAGDLSADNAGIRDWQPARHRYAQALAGGDPHATAPMAASGTSASVSMLACCSHHATDVLPFLGLSGISIFLTRYQVPLLTVSLVINAIGIAIMIRHIRNF